MRLSKNFTLAELTATDTGLNNQPTTSDVETLRLFCEKVLQPLRFSLGAPITVTSGYRSPAVNRAVGGAEYSDHLMEDGAVAADIKVAGWDLEKVIGRIVKWNLPVTKVILYPTWIHISSHVEKMEEPKLMRAVRVDGKITYPKLELG